MSDAPFNEEDIVWRWEPDDSTKYGSSWVDMYVFVKEQGRVRMWFHREEQWTQGPFLPAWGEEMLRQIQEDVDEAWARVEDEVNARVGQRAIGGGIK